jgi:hypothetical protein
MKILVRVLVALLFFVNAIGCRAMDVNLDKTKILRCENITLANSGVGVPFSNRVVNEDYGLTVTIPRNYIGWSGVDPRAPFHGFTIFLGGELTACIDLEIHIRVDEDKKPTYPERSKKIELSGITGRQTKISGKIDGEEYVNLRTVFSCVHGKNTSDGELILIVPMSNIAMSLDLYTGVLNSMSCH